MAYDVDSKKKLSTKFTQSDKKSHLIIIQSSVKKNLRMIKMGSVVSGPHTLCDHRVISPTVRD